MQSTGAGSNFFAIFDTSEDSPQRSLARPVPGIGARTLTRLGTAYLGQWKVARLQIAAPLQDFTERSSTAPSPPMNWGWLVHHRRCNRDHIRDRSRDLLCRASRAGNVASDLSHPALISLAARCSPDQTRGTSLGQLVEHFLVSFLCLFWIGRMLIAGLGSPSRDRRSHNRFRAKRYRSCRNHQL
jgi:hypothetical protein